MKRIILLCAVVLMLVNCSSSYSESPTWSLTDINGKSHTFPESAKDKTTIILFWATWCPYCKRLMPHLQSALYQYGEQLNLQIFALNINEDANPAEYIEENGYDFLLFKNAEEVAKLYEIKGTPGLLVFDTNGQLRFDLRKVQSGHLLKKDSPHWQTAIKTAPYWGSELRKSLELLQ